MPEQIYLGLVCLYCNLFCTTQWKSDEQLLRPRVQRTQFDREDVGAGLEYPLKKETPISHWYPHEMRPSQMIG